MRTVVALYRDFDTAEDVVQNLVDSGFDRAAISLAASDTRGEYARIAEVASAEDVTAEEGVAFGSIVGALVGFGVAAIPGIGPVLAAGPLASALLGAGVGAVAGAATGGLVAGLIDMGIPEVDATYYAEGVRGGSVLVAARVEEAWVDNVIDIMKTHNPISVETRVSDTATAQRAVGVSSYTTPEHDFESFRGDFEHHFESTYMPTQYTYTYYVPAYRLGYDLARAEMYHDWDWGRLEPEARRRWETEHDTLWDDIRESVEYAWRRVKQALS